MSDRASAVAVGVLHKARTFPTLSRRVEVLLESQENKLTERIVDVNRVMNPKGSHITKNKF